MKAILFALLLLPFFASAETGVIATWADSKFCVPNGSIATYYAGFDLNESDETVPFDYYASTARTGVNNCRIAIYVDETTNWNTFDYLYLDYDITVTSGSCGVGLSWSNSAQYASGQYHTTSSSSARYTINNAGGGWDGLIGMGVVLYGQSGQTANCTGNITRIHDDLGNDYLNFYDTTDGGGGGEATTTTEYVYIPVDVEIISSTCVEETATTTGMATTTCNNVLSTTTVYSWLDTSASTTAYETLQTLKTIFLYAVWLTSFCLIFGVLLLFIRGRYGHY